MTKSLTEMSCRPYDKDEAPLKSEEIESYMQQTPDWSRDKEHSAIYRAFKFNNFYETMAFVNALAYIAHREDHHPDVLEVGYKQCRVRYTTHSVGGLSLNDFICAAKIDRLQL